VLTAINNSGTATLVYDLLGQITSSDENGLTVGYTYDEEGNRLTITYPGSKTVTTVYDELGDATSVTDHDGTGVVYTYDFEQRLIKSTYTGGSTTEYDYNKAGCLVEQKEVTPGNVTLRSLTYSYDDAGNLMTENRTGVKYDRRSEMIAYSYDRANKLVSEKIDGVTRANTYDKAGNLLNDGEYTYTYDRQNRLTQKVGTGGTTTYTYDNSGNLIKETSPQGEATYTYNAQDRLIKGEKSTGETSEYVYNALGVRVSNIQIRKNQNAGHANADLDNGSIHIQDYTPALDDDRATWQRVWESEVGTTAQNDFETVTKQYVVDYTSGVHRDILIIENGSFEQRYVYGADAERLSVEFNYADGTGRGTVNASGEYGENLASDFAVNDLTKVWYRVNMLGTSLYVVDAAYAIRAHAEYDIWGDPLTETYADANYSGLEELVSFTSYAWDITLELYFAQNRFYDADEHRFTQQDPVKDGGNWYVYVGNNPLTRVDPTGKWAVGDSNYPQEAQIQLLALTYAYFRAPDDMSRTNIEEVAKMVRRTNKKSPGNALPISEDIESILQTKSALTKITLNSALRKYRIEFTITPASFRTYKMHIGLSNENLLTVTDGTNTFSGGNQAWLPTSYLQATACGSIAIANIVLYYFEKYGCSSVSFNADGSISKSDYLKYYNSLFYDPYYMSMDGVIPKYDNPIVAAWALEDIVNTELGIAGISMNSTNVSTITTSASKALGMVAGSLMKDNPVALQNWTGATGNVTELHWVTITAADIDVFDFVNSTVTFSSWGRLYNNNDANHKGYTFSDAWQGKASIVFFAL
jgi:RHS repeat-associated protein